MKLLTMLSLFCITCTNARCPGISFNGRYYEVETLKDGINRVHQLALNRHDNILYFIYEQIAFQKTKAIGYLNLNTRESGVIDGVRNASSIAIDNVNNVVYVGGADGIYKVNNKTLEFLPIRDRIETMFFKDTLYYTNARLDAFTYQNGFIDPVYEVRGLGVENLILDDDENIFFIQQKTLFRVKRGTLPVSSHEGYNVGQLTVDNHFKPYITSDRGVFVYNKYKYVMDRVSDMSNLRGLTFNRDNEPIFAVLDSIYELKYSANKCLN